MMPFPTSVDPVKPTFLTSGCSMSAMPATEPAGEQVPVVGYTVLLYQLEGDETPLDVSTVMKILSMFQL